MRNQRRITDCNLFYSAADTSTLMPLSESMQLHSIKEKETIALSETSVTVIPIYASSLLSNNYLVHEETET